MRRVAAPESRFESGAIARPRGIMVIPAGGGSFPGHRKDGIYRLTPVRRRNSVASYTGAAPGGRVLKRRCTHRYCSAFRSI